MPHRRIQAAADRISLLAAGASESPWTWDPDNGDQAIVSSEDTIVRPEPDGLTKEKRIQSRLDAEYILLMQPMIGKHLSDMLESQAALHADSPPRCSYCNPEYNPLNLPCPVLNLADNILAIPEVTPTSLFNPDDM